MSFTDHPLSSVTMATDNLTTLLYGNTTDPSNTTNLTIAEIMAYHRPSIGYIEKFLTPLWYVIGIPGNILTAFVWTRKTMRQSSGTFLAALALTDLLFLFTHIIFYLQQFWGYKILDFPVMCELYPITFLGLQYLSPLLVLAFTVERYLQILHPFALQTHPCTRRTSIFVLILVLASLGFNAIQGYFWSYDATAEECSPREVVIKGDHFSIWTVWTFVSEMLVFAVVPIVILALNIRVITVMRDHSRRDVRSPRKSSATTVTLLAVSFYLILSTLPVSIIYVVILKFEVGKATDSHDYITNDRTWQNKLNYEMAKCIINQISMTHFAFNIFIYLATGRQFRKQLVLEIYKFFCPNKAHNLGKRGYDEIQMIKETKTNGSETHV